MNAKTGALGHVGVAFTFGFVIAAMVYAVGDISRAHFNPPSPSPSLSRATFRGRAGAYGLAQLFRGLLAAALLRAYQRVRGEETRPADPLGALSEPERKLKEAAQ